MDTSQAFHTSPVQAGASPGVAIANALRGGRVTLAEQAAVYHSAATGDDPLQPCQLVLRQKTRGAGQERRVTKLEVDVLRHDQDAGLWELRFDSARRGETIHARHHDVHKGPIRVFDWELEECLLPACALDEFLRDVSQHTADEHPHLGIVVNDEYFHWSRPVLGFTGYSSTQPPLLVNPWQPAKCLRGSPQAAT